jgi:hypothetical protein
LEQIMKVRSVKRLVLFGVAAGLVATVAVPVGFTGGSVGDLFLVARNTDATSKPGSTFGKSDTVGTLGKFRRGSSGSPSTPDNGVTPQPVPSRTPVGAGRDETPGPPVVVKPGDGQTASPVPGPDPDDDPPVPAEPIPDGGIGGRSSLRFVTAVSDVSADRAKAAIATCPAGTRIYGGGGKINRPGLVEGQNGDLMLDSLRPASANGRDGFVATAKQRPVEDKAGSSLGWSVEAFAVCGRELPGYERVVASDGDVDRRVTATAVCPNGKRVIGVGGTVSDPFDMFSFDQLMPDAEGRSVTVTGVDDSTDGVRSAFRFVNAVAV